MKGYGAHLVLHDFVMALHVEEHLLVVQIRDGDLHLIRVYSQRMHGGWAY